MKPKTIYAASQGCYSDYRVVALFSTEADAALFMERHKTRWSDWNDIETFVLDAGVPKMRKGFSHYMIQMKKDGSTVSVEADSSGLDAEPDVEFRGKTGTVMDMQWFNWYGWARDSAHAVKVANEHRIKLLAQQDNPSGGAS